MENLRALLDQCPLIINLDLFYQLYDMQSAFYRDAIYISTLCLTALHSELPSMKKKKKKFICHEQ